MKMQLLKFTFILSIFFTNVAFSDTSEINYNNENRNCKENVKKYCNPCCCEDYCTCCPRLPLPVVCGWAFMEGEYLYWKAYGYTPYGGKGAIVPPFTIPPSDTESQSASTQLIGFSANSGFRVTLGGYCGKCWYGRARYTQYFTDETEGFTVSDPMATSSSAGQPVNLYWQLIIVKISDNTSAVIEAKNRLRQKLLDFDVLRSFSCSRFTFNPFIGVRFGWIKTDLRVDHKFESSTEPPQVDHIDINNHFNLGVGIRSGLDMDLDIGCGFGFYSNASFSALVGQRYFRIRDEFLRIPVTGDQTQDYKKTDFLMTTQFGTGINWGTHFCCCRYYLGVKLGYEINYWPDFISYSEVFLGQAGTTLPLQWANWSRSIFVHGLNVGLRFDF